MSYLALYDVRGIQDFIYRTPKVKDAIGASAMVDMLFEDIIQGAINAYNDRQKSAGKTALKCQLEWSKVDPQSSNYPQPLPYSVQTDMDIEIVYIGGGNAYLLFKDEQVCIDVSKEMSYQVFLKTYSLQLASAYQKVTGNYGKDYQQLNAKIVESKEKMVVSKPIGAFPVMSIEVSTGLPISEKNNNNEGVSREVYLKRTTETKVRENVDEETRKFESYMKEHGENSRLAIVHLDGNSMGNRIQALMSNEEDYSVAINKIRTISLNIRNSYSRVFDKMKTRFNTNGSFHILKILVAGDDITYLCTAEVAMPSIEYFVSRISNYNNYYLFESCEAQSYSICAGIAYFVGHYPFYQAYQVAEACASSAKKRAKSANYSDSTIGNWVDFQFVKNIQATNVERVRENQYVTMNRSNLPSSLLIRPYYIKGFSSATIDKKVPDHLYFNSNQYDTTNVKALDYLVRYFGNEQNLPRSFAKQMRNTYSEGEKAMEQLMGFLKSRGIVMPDGTYESFENDVAKWYDALELLDDYISLEEVFNITSGGEVTE